jgi:hypothetical protein
MMSHNLGFYEGLMLTRVTLVDPFTLGSADYYLVDLVRGYPYEAITSAEKIPSESIKGTVKIISRLLFKT